MTDLDERIEEAFGRLGAELLPGQDLLAPEAALDALQDASGDAAARPRRVRSPGILVAAALALVVVLAIVLLGSGGGDPVEVGPAEEGLPGEVADAAAVALLSAPDPVLRLPDWASGLAPGWHDLPPPTVAPPTEGLPPTLVVPTPEAVLVLGPAEADPEAPARGLALHLAERRWEDATPPVRWQEVAGVLPAGDAVVLWTARELWRWHAGEGWSAPDPPPSSLGGGTPTVQDPAAVAGDEVLFWADSLAYDLAEGTWRELPAIPHLPARAAAAWDGHELLVVGMTEESLPFVDADLGEVGFALDPRTGEWRDLPPTGLFPLALAMERYGEHVVAVDHASQAATYDRTLDRWHVLPPVPPVSSSAQPSLVAAGPYLFASGDGTAVLDPAGRWTPVATLGPVVAAEGVLFAWDGGLRAYVPPVPERSGELPPPAELFVAPWTLTVPPGFASRGARAIARPELGVERVEVELAAPSGTCTLRRGVLDPPAAQWWDDADPIAAVPGGPGLVLPEVEGRMVDPGSGHPDAQGPRALLGIGGEELVLATLVCVAQEPDGRAEALKDARDLLGSLRGDGES